MSPSVWADAIALVEQRLRDELDRERKGDGPGYPPFVLMEVIKAMRVRQAQAGEDAVA